MGGGASAVKKPSADVGGTNGTKTIKEAMQDLADDTANRKDELQKKWKQKQSQRASLIAWQRVKDRLKETGFARAVLLRLDITILQQEFALEENLAQMLGWTNSTSSGGRRTLVKSREAGMESQDAIREEDPGAADASDAPITIGDIPTLSDKELMQPVHELLEAERARIEERLQEVGTKLMTSVEEELSTSVQQMQKALEESGPPMYKKLAHDLGGLLEAVIDAIQGVQQAVSKAKSCYKKWQDFIQKAEGLLQAIKDGERMDRATLEDAVKSCKDAMIAILDMFTTVRRKVRNLEKKLQEFDSSLTQAIKAAEKDPQLNGLLTEAVEKLRSAQTWVQDLAGKAADEVRELRNHSQKSEELKKVMVRIVKDISRCAVRRIAAKLAEQEEDEDGADDDDSDEEESAQRAETADEVIGKVADLVDNLMDTVITKAQALVKSVQSDLKVAMGFHWGDWLKLQFTVTLQLKVVADCLVERATKSLEQNV